MDKQAIEAVKTLIKWIGDDPERDGLKDTPKRFLASLKEFFSGYKQNPNEILSKTFKEIDGYNDLILLKNIEFYSHCEHHIAPIIGKAHVCYVPNLQVIGISKLARLVEIYTRRLQVQERLTAQIANTIYNNNNLKPLGVAVMIEASHHCMACRGIAKSQAKMKTQTFLGCFTTEEWRKKLQQAFLSE